MRVQRDGRSVTVEVRADGEGLVSRAGSALLVQVADKSALTRALSTDQGPVRVRSPRDRNGTFEPQIVAKRQTRWVGFDDRVIAL